MFNSINAMFGFWFAVDNNELVIDCNIWLFINLLPSFAISASSIKELEFDNDFIIVRELVFLYKLRWATKLDMLVLTVIDIQHLHILYTCQ